MLHYLYVYVRNTTSFKLETSHPSSQRTLFNLAQTPGNLATVWGGPYVNVFDVRNQHLESSIYSRVAWARTSIHVQEYGTRHQHDFHLTPYFLESVLEQYLQPHHFSNSAIARQARWGLPIVGFHNCSPTCKANSNALSIYRCTLLPNTKTCIHSITQ